MSNNAPRPVFYKTAAGYTRMIAFSSRNPTGVAAVIGDGPIDSSLPTSIASGKALEVERGAFKEIPAIGVRHVDNSNAIDDTYNNII